MLQVTILNPVTGCCSRLKQKSHTLTWWSVSDIFWAVDRGHCSRNGIWNDDTCLVILSQCQLLAALLWRWRITKGKRKCTLTGSAERCVPCQLPVCVVLKGICLASVCCAVKPVGGPNLWAPHRLNALDGIKIRTVASGCNACHSVAITEDGKVYTWGQCVHAYEYCECMCDINDDVNSVMFLKL